MATNTPTKPASTGPTRSQVLAQVETAEKALETALVALRTMRQALEGRDHAKEAIAAWLAGWQARYGGQYQFAEGDRANLTRLARKLGADDLIGRLTRYLKDTDPTLRSSRHPLGWFWKRINSYAVVVAPVALETGEARPPVACRHTPPCRSDREHTAKAMDDVYGAAR